jgi:hypothetical protein
VHLAEGYQALNADGHANWLHERSGVLIGANVDKTDHALQETWWNSFFEQ